MPTVREGRLVFVVMQDGQEPVAFRVDGVLGGGHMLGGGTQGFVSRFPDGTVRLLPFEFIRREGKWFCNTASRVDRGWIPITTDVALADCGDWPPQRVLGSHPRYGGCQQCHGSQIDLRFDLQERRYRTEFASLAINCESCHGPGRRHVAMARAGGLGTSADIGIAVFSTGGKDQSLEVCFQCHALKEEPGVGDYSLKLALLGERPMHADGRVRTFAYQEGHLYSDCYLNGAMTCVSCHDPHSQRYRDVSGNTLASRFADEQCTGCHTSKVGAVERHTNHAPASAGSRCVNCHMPYLQQPAVGAALRYARSDHTIPVPRPRHEAALGVRGACVQCHADRSIEQLSRDVERWYGSLKPLPAIVARLARADSLHDAGATAELFLSPDANHPMAQAAGLSLLLGRLERPDAGLLGASARERLRRLARHPDLDVRALALALLHWDHGANAGTRRFLARRLVEEQAADAALRRRWAFVAGSAGDRLRARGDAPSAIAAYRKALEVLPGNARIIANLAAAYVAAGDPLTAIQLYHESLRHDSTQALTYVNLGIAHGRANDPAGAASAYRQAIEINPFEPLAYFNLGNYHWRRQEVGAAITAYERAVQLDPGLGAAQFQLARAYVAANRLRDAARAARRAVEFDPPNPLAQGLLADIERALSRGAAR